MKVCPFCGEENRDNTILCVFCGGHLDGSQTKAPSQQQTNSYYPSYPQKVAYHPNGGLIAWSILTILLCTIPGVIALVNAASINNCTAYSVQENRISAAKAWNIIGTILGILALIITIAANANR